METQTVQRPSRDEAVRVAFRKFTGELMSMREGTLTADEFRPTRTILGVYGQRQPEQHMVRVRLPYGAVTPDQLRALAEVARDYGNGTGHLTTRQDMQIHWMLLDDMPRVLDRLRQAGLTSLQAGGNSVRNIAACPLAGVCGKEAFDVGPYAAGLDEFYVGNPAVQALPRKFKSSLSGCAVDCALTGIQDFGAVATVREDGARGFRVYLAGGLGSFPQPGVLLDEFVPQSELGATYEAALRVFERLGDRSRKDRARLKFVAARLGDVEFRRLVQEERARVLQEDLEFTRPRTMEELPELRGEVDGAAWSDPAFRGWSRANVSAEQTPGRASVAVGLPLGDITSAQMEALADLVGRQPGVTIRTSVLQDLYLRGVPVSAVYTIYETLRDMGLGVLHVGGVADIVSCPGTSACSLGIAASKGIARELQRVLLEAGVQDDPDLAPLRIKASGCTDACGQHHLADIGLCGAALHQAGRLYPGHVLYLGGRVGEDGMRIGQPIMKVPARRVPEAVLRLLQWFKAERHEGEEFGDFAERRGAGAVRELLKDLTRIPGFEEDPSNFVDWDATRMFILERGEGECAV